MVIRASGVPVTYEAKLFHWENGARVGNMKLPVVTSIENGFLYVTSTDEVQRLHVKIDVAKVYATTLAIGYDGEMDFVKITNKDFKENVFCRLLPGQTKE
jgi:hypothetical protein